MAESDEQIIKTTSEGYGQRVGNSLIGAVVGIVLITLAVVLLFWNEGRAVKTARSISKGRSEVVNVSPNTVHSENDGKLIHVTGMADTSDVLVDPVFKVSAKALCLVREVEMFQWQERQRTKTRKLIGGRREHVTVYDYSTVWTNRLIDSNRFEDSTNHHNPQQMPFKPRTFSAQRAHLGAFRLPTRLEEQIAAREVLPVTSSQIKAIAASDTNYTVLQSDDGIYVGKDPADPKIGDTRVTFRIAAPQIVSIVAMQQDGTFAPYQVTASRTIQIISVGKQTANAMFTRAEKKNHVVTWILRAVGFGLMLVGFGLVLVPLSVIASFVPVLGRLVDAGVILVASLLAFSLSLITIAIGWITYRPVLGIILLVVAGGAFLAIGRIGASRNARSRAK